MAVSEMKNCLTVQVFLKDFRFVSEDFLDLDPFFHLFYYWINLFTSAKRINAAVFFIPVLSIKACL